MSGTTPKGIHDERQAAAWVREMFGQVAPKYDLLNHLLSANVDKMWRARTVKRVMPVLRRADARVLDLCCGTGDLAIALREKAAAQILASDFCHPMLTAAARKAPLTLFEADALQLPLADQSLDLITVAFGFRNLVNYESGLRELRRVLRPGGTLAILEFSQPPNPLFARFYDFYSNRVLPAIGSAISGAKEAYTYLPESVRKFPNAPALAELMRTTGYKEVAFERMTFGVVALHTGRR
ncbi:MAG: bifunctional demethylmenaquinone methyltransferase/2-methoxy-6-polyprenyl-1,4-benzoquinol methylase UbiE [Bryobacteraceae bacterium]|nr:bifunctional demethylmenaquinone methyltransferase/2-methoxy-6-polyprenyl-1,4-benzoquinol methylase UbiE [Bryobacteraceae bacterium]